jgi:pseudouridine-5'-monophosphatase
MDGLLLDSEDKYTLCTNTVLQKYGRPLLPWSIKAQLQGRPGPAASQILHEWAQLPVSKDVYYDEVKELQKIHFPDSKPLPGVEKLLSDLSTATVNEKEGKKGKIHVALATSSHKQNFKMKTAHLEDLFTIFPQERRVLGDDVRIPEGRGKPSPDIYQLALKTINSSLEEGEVEIRPDECLVFEDSVPGVEAGRRAGMRVIWCPHPELRKEYDGQEEHVLAGRTGSAGEVDMHLVGELGDGWGEYLESLVDFPYAKYGIVVDG